MPDPTSSNPISEREQRILKFWQDNKIFEKSLEKASPKGNFVFYDGPPFATGLPHFGNALASVLKDVIPRYKTMRGYHVPRRWGWDCHGLPIENLIEKELGLKTKRDIETIGIEKFNKAARDSVFRYTDQWKQIIPRLGRWVDMENDYRSMDATYTESVWWSYKELHKKGLVYEGYKVMPYCYRCGTTLANFEVNLGYKDITDVSAYVKFKLAQDPKDGLDPSDTYFLAWTTTPWTLPGNVALAVNPGLAYVKIEVREDAKTHARENISGKDAGRERYILAKDRLAVIKGEYEIVDEYKGKDLAGKAYLPPFDYYKDGAGLLAGDQDKIKNAWKVYGADFVTAEDGTGIVHIAPAFGADDLKLAEKHELPVIHHVGPDGAFKKEVTDFAGRIVKLKDGPTAEQKDDHQKTDIEIIRRLAHAGLLFAKEKHAHSYPHCWRCDTPLLNYATSSWFVKVTALKDRLIAANKKIQWTPEAIGEGRFGKWLEGARDWAVSRSRFWGAPIPVWKGELSGKTQFIGSLSELKSKLPTNGNSYILMRHGEAESNVRDVINSRDKEKYGLTEKGRMEAKKSATALRERWGIRERNGAPIVIYRSEFRRTRETAEIVAKILSVDTAEIIVDPRLNENNAGDFEGGTWSTHAKYLGGSYEKIYRKAPNGESIDDVRKRMGDFLYDIHEKNKDSRVLIVTHGLPLRMAKQVAEGRSTRSMLHLKWHDSDPTASLHALDFRALPRNEECEIDLHRPYIDQVTWQSGEGSARETMRRVPEIFDVWYDSGSMPFAQNHYPFEHKHQFDARDSFLFPADYIAEGIDQTRGWFYVLLALSVGLFGKAAFNNVLVNGLVLAEDGRKMSKSLKNYPDIMPTIEKYGADALRYFMLASPLVEAEDVAFSEKAIDEVNKKHFNRLSNVFTFYEMYRADHGNTSRSASANPAAPKNILDAWILARLEELVQGVTDGLEAYELDRAMRPFAEFIDDLSTWYLRRSRDRFKGEDAADKARALQTTAYVLHMLSVLLAPFTPFFAEDLYQKVKTGMKESVHLEEWPSASGPKTDLKNRGIFLLKKMFKMKGSSAISPVLEQMARARKMVEAGLALRSKSGIKVRQPLASVQYEFSAGRGALNAEYERMIADELNVKEVLNVKGLDAEDLGGMKVALDVHITKELKEEGAVRDVIRAVQDARKAAELSPHDAISIRMEAGEEMARIISAHEDMIKKATLTKEIKIVASASGTAPEMKIEVKKI